MSAWNRIARGASAPARWLLLLLAAVSLALAVLGLFLPVLPTVPFVLLAAWAAARSSPRLEQALLRHPRFGPALRDWRSAGVVRRPAKRAATLAMALSGAGILLLVTNTWAQAAALVCMATVLLWLWRRPENGAQS
jgi:uncharacterized membrane protein YbaN (DUF454 family)